MVEKHLDKRIEEKLASYRAQKRRNEKNRKVTESLTHYVNVIVNFVTIPFRYTLPDNVNEYAKIDAPNNLLKIKSERLSRRKKLTEDFDVDHNTIEDNYFENENIGLSRRYTYLDWIIFLLKCLLWGVLWKIFILLEFGAVFFVLSGFVFIWLNLRSDTNKTGISAYSVFNPNCEQILGTYSAEKLEKELLFR